MEEGLFVSPRSRVRKSKVCRACLRRRKISLFHPHWKSPDGYRKECVDCLAVTASPEETRDANDHFKSCACLYCERRRVVLERETVRIRSLMATGSDWDQRRREA